MSDHATLTAKLATATGSRAVKVATWWGQCGRYPLHVATVITDQVDPPGGPFDMPWPAQMDDPRACRECGAGVPSGVHVSRHRVPVFADGGTVNG